MATKRRKLTAEDIPEVQDKERNVLETLIPETEIVGSVIYEQDLRAASHSNGRTSHMVGSSIENPPPPESPDDPDRHGDDHKAAPKGLRYFLAGVYLSAGILGIYVGITMIRDLKKEK